MKTKADYIVRAMFLGIFLCIAIAVMVLFASCNGCKKPVEPVPGVVDVIEQTHNPKIDSLKKLSFVLIDSIGKLNTELAKQKNKTAIAESKATATSERLKSALKNKDTVEIIVYAKDITEEYDNYRQHTVTQDSIQEAVIEKQTATIINDRAEIELHESKYNLLKQSHTSLEYENKILRSENSTLKKKVKRRGFWGKVFGFGFGAAVVKEVVTGVIKK